MKTAVIYARYSSSNQTEQSIEGQLRVCNQYAENQGILILDTYIDRAMTGTNDNRADFQRMIKDSGKREWDYVLVYKLDRFSRDKYGTAVYRKALKDNGVKLLSATECIPDTPEGIIVESLIEGMGQFYSEELSQKVRRGMNETRQKGNFTGGYVLYGYKIVNKKVVIDEEKAEVIRYIFNQYLLDVQVKEIIATLRERGILNHGKPFARSTVYRLLENEKYAGVYRHGEEIFENIYPPIISREIFAKAAEKAKANKYGKRSVEQNRNSMRMSASDIREYYKKALILESEALINYLVKEVVLYDDKIEIYFNTPTRTSPDENRGFSVCIQTVGRLNIEILIK